MKLIEVRTLDAMGLNVITNFVLTLILFFLVMNIPLTAQKIDEEDYSINLKSRKFIPEPGIKSDLLSSLKTEITDKKKSSHIMIQFSKLPSLMEKQWLKNKGITLLNYIGGNTWCASLSDAKTLSFTESEEVKKEPTLSIIRWIGEITPEDKIAPLIKENKIGDWALNTDGKVNLILSYFADVDTNLIKNNLQILGADLVGKVPGRNKFIISIEEQKIINVASKDFIQWIEVIPPPPIPESNRIRVHVQSELVQGNPLNLSGNGVIVGVFENHHIWKNHQDYSGRVFQMDGTAYAPGQHTTMVAGIIGGNGSQSNSNGGTTDQWKGMAPEVDLYSYNFETHSGEAQNYLDFEGDLQKAIGTDHIDIANNSWGNTGGCNEFLYGVYEGLCPELDAAVRGDNGKPIVIVFSAGNDRDGYGDSDNKECISDKNAPFKNYETVNYPKAAKNIIDVGAIDSYNDQMTAYSSWGPLADGRIKPDIVASGHDHGTPTSEISILNNVYGNPPNYTNGQGYRTPNYTTGSDTWVYAWMTQTSCAAATTSGCLALLLEYYRNRLNTDIDPLPSTMKALLIQSAKDLDDNTTWYNPGPDYASGYGLLQIKGAVDLVESLLFREGKVTTNRPDTYTFTLPANASSVKVTLVWDDPPASLNAANALVNDLDLKVYDPNDVQYYPWTLNPDNPSNDAVRTEADHINNTEQVFVDQNLTQGTWKVVVDPYMLPEPPQRYSLVANYLLDGEIDVIQVLDRSGSMSEPASTGMPDTKIQKLREAASQFIGIMKPNDANRLGLVQFNQDVVLFPADSKDTLSVLDGSKVNQLQTTTVPGIVEGGLTSIGDGLREALNQFTTISVEPERDRAILLVTDGKENSAEMIATVQPDLIANDVTVYALGLGYGSGIDENKLVNLAEATNGTYRITSDHLVFQKLFIETLAGAVNWSVINDPVGTITRDEVIKVPVVITPDQMGVTFTAYWEGFNDAIKLILMTPSGKEISEGNRYNKIRYEKNARYIIYQIDFPLTGDLTNDWSGEWQMKLTGTDQIDNNVKVRYSTSAFAENGPKLKVDFDRLFNLTGDEVQLKAYLTRNGMPITGATINVFGDVPLNGVGNVLHDGKVNWDQLHKTVVVKGDTLSLIDHKLQLLSKQAGEDILKRGTSDFKLYDDGLHGDGAADDGFYANKFSETKTQGSYTFRFAADIPGDEGLNSTCEWTKSFYDEVNINPANSDISFVPGPFTPTGRVYNLNVVLKDKFGNYLGPGHDVSANIIFNGTAREVKLSDNIDGTYSQGINLSNDEINSNVKTEIYVDGDKFTEIKVPVKRWSASLHAGVAIPTGTFANSYDPGYNVLVDAGYHITNQWSIKAFFGYNNFKSKITGIDDTYIINVSANVRYELLLAGPWSFYLGAGPGIYIPKNGDTKSGGNAGLGFNYDYNGSIIFELGGDYHTVFGNNTKFIHNHVGIIYRF